METSREFMRRGPWRGSLRRCISLWIGAFLLCVGAYVLAPTPAQAADLSGVYTVQGAKGPIVLTLKKEGANLTGSLKGGEFAALLKGFPEAEADVFLGTMSDDRGAFLSFFRVFKEGNQIILEAIPQGAGGEPDMKHKTRFLFPLDTGKGDNPDTKPNTKPDGKAPSFAGIFKDEEITLESKAETGKPDTYSGTIKMGEQAMRFTARAEGNKLRGEFESEGEKFAFEATLEGRTLQFVTDGTTYSLSRPGNPLAKPPGSTGTKTPKPSNPLAKGNPSDKTSDKTAAALPSRTTTGGAAWKIYNHPTGLSVRYPPDWKLNTHEAYTMLTPPDVALVDQKPQEIYLLMGEGAQNITSVEDPKVIPYLEGEMQQLAPFLQRVGEAKKITIDATPGLLLSWEGTNPNGLRVRANVMATILKGYAIALLSMGDKDKIAARESVVKDVFASLAAGAGKRDPMLIGQWKFWGYKASADGKAGTETTRRFRFVEDGTCFWQSTTETSGTVTGRDAEGNQTLIGSVAGQGGNTDKGQWTADNGTLYVLWSDGSTGTWTYEVRPVNNSPHLFLKSDKKDADEWVPEG